MADTLKQQMQGRAQRRAGLTLERLRQQAARMETHGDVRVVDVPLDAISVDEAIQVRVAGVDPDKVAQYAVVFDEGGEFPPVVVFRDEESDALYLADGFHRVAAAERAGLDTIAAEVRPGGHAAAIEYAEEANLEHGFALSARDKRYILERRIRRGHEWATWSDRQIAQVLGVAHTTIGRWRQAIQEETQAATGAFAPVTERVGADGRVYNVENVQEANRRRAADARKVKAAEEAMLMLLQEAEWRSVPRATLINAAVAEGVDEAQAEAILQEVATFHKLVVTTTGQVVAVGVLLLGLLREAGGEMDFMSLAAEASEWGVDGETINTVLMELADAGSVVITGDDEMRVMSPRVAAERGRRQPVRYVGGEFNQDVGEEAAFGVPVVEEGPEPDSEEDFRALVEMYKGWVAEILGRGPAKYATLMQNIVGDDGAPQQIEAFIAAIGALTRAKQVINDGGYYRLARGYTPAVLPSAETVAEDGGIDGDGEGQTQTITLVELLRVYVALSAKVATRLANVKVGWEIVADGEKEAVRILADEALGLIQGYVPRDGELGKEGIATLLVMLLGILEGEGEAE